MAIDNEPGVPCPRYIARAPRFAGVMINDAGKAFIPVLILSVILSEFLPDIIVWPACIILFAILWGFLKATTDGKPDGTFDIWRHKNRIGRIRGLPRGVKNPVVFNSSQPKIVDPKKTLMPVPEKDEEGSRVWALGVPENREEKEPDLRGVVANIPHDSYYTKIGMLEMRLFRLRLIRWVLIALVGYMGYQYYLLHGIKRPAYFFEGYENAGFAKVKYVSGFNKEAWLSGNVR